MLSEIDVAISSAKFARDNDHCKPVLNDEISHDVVGGRHPVVEYVQKTRAGEVFNTCGSNSVVCE